MYLNLKTEMERNNITVEQIANTLEIHRNSAANKIEGRTSFTIEEALLLQEKHFQYSGFNYLFKKIKTSRQ